MLKNFSLIEQINLKGNLLYLDDSIQEMDSILELAAFEMLMQVKQRTNSQ